MKPLESAEYIVNHANDVKIQQPGVETVARLVGNTHTAAAYYPARRREKMSDLPLYLVIYTL